MDEPDLNKPWCYYVVENQDPAVHGGFVPSLVVEGSPQHWPMLGRGEGAAPWVWGKTLEDAQRVCRHVNEERGISQGEEERIVASSMLQALRQGKVV
ncbi:MAG: hypothetical protein ABFE07_28315 [Armatimonadia bacterium]